MGVLPGQTGPACDVGAMQTPSVEVAPGQEETGAGVMSLTGKGSHGLGDPGSTPDLAILRADLNLNLKICVSYSGGRQLLQTPSQLSRRVRQ